MKKLLLCLYIAISFMSAATVFAAENNSIFISTSDCSGPIKEYINKFGDVNKSGDVTIGTPFHIENTEEYFFPEIENGKITGFYTITYSDYKPYSGEGGPIELNNLKGINELNDGNIYTICSDEENTYAVSQNKSYLFTNDYVNYIVEKYDLKIAPPAIDNADRKVVNILEPLKYTNNKTSDIKLFNINQLDTIHENDRIYLSLRTVSEIAGGNIIWNDNTKTALVTYKESTISFTKDNNTILLNDKVYELDSPVLLRNGKMYISIYTADKAFDSNIKYDNNNKTISFEYY
ncbi:MAG: copper amine oxidase N-terminal domain-containing protein [Clostridia bacterium]|nr:copper amine oxidase N-terminal domain-containing protein [Clostridia bacterium]